MLLAKVAKQLDAEQREAEFFKSHELQKLEAQEFQEQLKNDPLAVIKMFLNGKPKGSFAYNHGLRLLNEISISPQEYKHILAENDRLFEFSQMTASVGVNVT
ncbi:MAG: hypothetical protein LBV04_09930 [Deferribacteraceae bacterium]|jgi:hypothetical protein|nr:hypothetical protein [Deferribacteraceae bacterium]